MTNALRTDEHEKAAARLRADPEHEIERAPARLREHERHPLAALGGGRWAMRAWRRMLERCDAWALLHTVLDINEHSIVMHRYSPWMR